MRVCYMWQQYKDGRKAIRRVNMDLPESTDGLLEKGVGLYARQHPLVIQYLEDQGNPVFGVDPIPEKIAEVLKEG